MLFAPCCYTQSIDLHGSDIGDDAAGSHRDGFKGLDEKDPFRSPQAIYGEES